MTEIEPYQGAAVAPRPEQTALALHGGAHDTDSWIQVVSNLSRLAAQIADTEFVPQAMRGKPAAVAAAMLAGREMGIAPMTSLQNIHVIQGKPGQSALLMRALVLAHGHQIDYVETTDSRAIVRGRRAGEEEWTTITFTADQAKRARIDLGGYPEDKLIARATARLCRRKFADVISGMAYTVEELQDGDAQLIDAGEAPPALEAGSGSATPAPAQRTAQRKPAAKRTSRTQTPGPQPASAPSSEKRPDSAPGGEDTGAAAPSSDGPPLPGEDGYDDERPHDDAPLDPQGPATTAMNRKMHALFKEADCTAREDRLYLTGLLLDRQLDTSKGLTVEDGKAVIDALENLKAAGHPEGLVGAVNDLMNAAEQRRMEAAEQSDGGEQK